MLSFLGDFVGGLLGLNGVSDKDQTIQSLQAELAAQQKQTSTYKTLTYLLGVGLLFCVYKIFRK